jgi:hypothetical protein
VILLLSFVLPDHILDPTSQYRNAVEEQKLSLEEPILTVDSEAGTAITISEQFKVAGRKLTAHLADPEVEGVYETKMPLDLYAVLQLGCVCKVDINTRNHNLRDGWNLSELHMKTTTECPYMQDPVAFFYLYHSVSEGRGLFALHIPASNMVSVVVVNPFQNRELSSGQIEKQFREGLRCSGASNVDTHFDSIPTVFKVGAWFEGDSSQ